MIRLRSCHLRASRYGGQVTAAARQALITAAVVIVFGGSSLLACPVCFGAEETSMIDGAKLGVLVMLVVTLAVQGAFLAFFLYLRKRAKHIADVDLDNEWSELQGAPKTL
jgi:heme/copper-type cytochrome/quinol oxidase subunit 2